MKQSRIFQLTLLLLLTGMIYSPASFANETLTQPDANATISPEAVAAAKKSPILQSPEEEKNSRDRASDHKAKIRTIVQDSDSPLSPLQKFHDSGQYIKESQPLT